MSCINYNEASTDCMNCVAGIVHSPWAATMCINYKKGEENMNKIKINFAKTKPDAKIPSKRDEDMGYDIYACFDDEYMIIEPHKTELIPTGIASACDKGYGFVLKERGSTGTRGIAQRCGIIDSGYRSEWFVPITNTTDRRIVIIKDSCGIMFDDNTVLYPYEKAICQALVVPVPDTEVEEISYEELQNISSERGSGALGSSGK